ERVAALVAGERRVIVSGLARLEALSPGLPPRDRAVRARGDAARAGAHRRAAAVTLLTEAFCRTLDRLHLAAMQQLCIGRLLTNDHAQAAVARELGLEVVMPRPR